MYGIASKVVARVVPVKPVSFCNLAYYTLHRVRPIAKMHKVLFITSFLLLVFRYVAAEQSPVCTQGIYAAFQGLANNADAQKFCSKNYPLAATTITVAVKKRRVQATASTSSQIASIQKSTTTSSSRSTTTSTKSTSTKTSSTPTTTTTTTTTTTNVCLSNKS